jgi:hypothetical protein
MKSVYAILGLAVLVVTAGCLDQAGGTRSYKGPLFHYHFAGRTHLAAGTNATRFKEIDALPETAELRGHIAQKLAAAALPFWRKELPAGATDQSTLLRPLVDDFLAAEACVEVRGAAGATDTALAIELPEARAQLWSKNLQQLMTAWKLGTPRDLTAEGFKGWAAKRTQAPNTFQFFRAGKWVVLGLGQERLAQLPAWLSEAKRTGRPVAALTNSFLELAADLPGLRPWVPVLAQWPLPPVRATLSGRGENVRTEVRFQYAGKVPWRPEPWKIPTQLVGEPLTSFTLGQGIAPLLGRVKGLADVGLKPLPNQFCAWGVNNEQCRMYFAVPVTDSTNAMHRLSLGVPKWLLATFTNALGDFLYSSNRAELIWSGVPFIVPRLRPEKSGRDEYLMAGLFPLAGNQTPAPDELFAQVRGRTNLLYYDWEITEHRALHGNMFYQLASIVDNRPPPSASRVSQRWLTAIAPKLGNTATEITLASPQELLLVRRSHLGFTGFELATLSLWLESPQFPFDIQRPTLHPAPRAASATANATTPGAKANAANTPAPKAAPVPPAGQR